MVMPFSRSRSIESSTRSSTSDPARKAPVCHSMASTSVVFPWSTWATMATFRRSSRQGMQGPSEERGLDQVYRRSGAARLADLPEMAVGVAEESPDLPLVLDRRREELGAAGTERLVGTAAVGDPD